MKRFLYLVILFASLAPCAARAQDAAITFLDEIPYVSRDAGKTVIFGDLYRPASEDKLPGIVFAHGGGFVAGSKDAFGIPEMSRYLAQNGFVVFAVDYRLLQNGGLFPKNAQDVKCAVQWLRAHAAEHNVDTDRIAILGNSAGGYMASFVSVTQHNDTFNASCGDPALDAQKPEVDLAVAWYGVHDFSTMKHNLVKTLELSYFVKIKDKAAFKKEISPIQYADQAPPMLMLHGTVDQLVPYDQSVSMCQAVKDAGGDCTLVEFPGADHGFIGEKWGTPDSDRGLSLTVDWLREHFAAR